MVLGVGGQAPIPIVAANQEVPLLAGYTATIAKVLKKWHRVYRDRGADNKVR